MYVARGPYRKVEIKNCSDSSNFLKLLSSEISVTLLLYYFITLGSIIILIPQITKTRH